MMSDPRQFCKDIILSTERYSKSTALKVVDMLISHERVILIEQLVDRELPEDEFLAELRKFEKEGNDDG